MSRGEEKMAMERCRDRLAFLIRRRARCDEAHARDAATRILAFTIPTGEPSAPGDIRRAVLEMRRRFASPTEG